jgi:hypothetical protein
VTWEEAVAHWYDTLYLPLVQIIREQNILRDFPRRTEADLYLWIMDHHYFLSETAGAVALEDAAMDFAQHYSERLDKKLIRAVREAAEEFLGKSDWLPLIGTLASEPQHPHNGNDDEQA